MYDLLDLGKRVLVGRALRSGQLHQTLLPKRIALPVFANDALSSVAYAPQRLRGRGEPFAPGDSRRPRSG